jgi:uncharacterized membrane protein YccC
MVVKPDFTTTLVRGALRLIGTVGAVVVVGVLLDVTGNPQWLMAGLVVVFAPLTMRWISANYAFGAFAISCTVLVLIEAGDPGITPVNARLINTLIGAVIAILAYLLWPTWRGDTLRDKLSTALTTQREWTKLVLAGLGSGSMDAIAARTAGAAARNAMLAARPATEAAILEPHKAACDPQAGLGLIDACERAATATMALEVGLKAGGSNRRPAVPEAVSRVTDHVDTDFQSAIRLVAGGPADTSAVSAQMNALAAAPDFAAVVGGANWPSQTDARSISLLVVAADAAVTAAWRLNPT